jgi:hypothetical protein
MDHQSFMTPSYSYHFRFHRMWAFTFHQTLLGSLSAQTSLQMNCFQRKYRIWELDARHLIPFLPVSYYATVFVQKYSKGLTSRRILLALLRLYFKVSTDFEIVWAITSLWAITEWFNCHLDLQIQLEKAQITLRVLVDWKAGQLGCCVS